MYKILTLNKISSVGTDCLPKDKYTVLNEEANPDGILLRSFNMHEMEMPESLLAIGRAGAGTNNIPSDKCAEQGIVVFNTPGANANAVKELVIAGLFLSSRKVVNGINWAQSLQGEEGVAKLVEKGKGQFVGPEISGKKLGVVGLGAIGAMVANTAVALGMEVIGYDPFLSPAAAASLLPEVKVTKDLNDIYAESDYITVHVPLNNDTKYMFNDDTFDKVKKGLRLLNFSRGELVCNDAVKKAIAEGQVEAYVIDFPTEDILGVEGIITIPHLGASTPESEENCAYMAAMQVMNYIEKGNIKNSVNYPNCELEYTGSRRICVLSKEACIDSLASAVKESGLTVKNSAHEKRGGYAYAIFDVAEDAADVSKIEAVENVLKVRVI